MKFYNKLKTKILALIMNLFSKNYFQIFNSSKSLVPWLDSKINGVGLSLRHKNMNYGFKTLQTQKPANIDKHLNKFYSLFYFSVLPISTMLKFPRVWSNCKWDLGSLQYLMFGWMQLDHCSLWCLDECNRIIANFDVLMNAIGSLQFWTILANIPLSKSMGAYLDHCNLARS
jgi:hypothetical protein